MPVKLTTLAPLLAVGFIFYSSLGLAAKCLKAKSVEDLKNDFPVVIIGKVIKREKIDAKIFAIDISVQKLLKGKLAPKVLRANEVHFSNTQWRMYEVDKEYLLPVDTKGQKNIYEVFLPGDGCPEFLVEKIKPTTRNYAATSVSL
jgi:hypothetical protein